MTDLLAGQSIRNWQTAKHNLPAQLTTLIGRQREVAEVRSLLQRPEVGLVTLTGTGGVGKTRLGLHVAAEVVEEFAEGVFFISLAPISDPDLVVPTIAEVFGIKEVGDRILLDLLKAYLQYKCLLLVLDNFEQVLNSAVQVAELLASCPHIKVLVTSRAVLHVRGEQEFPVPPLAIPNLKQISDLIALSRYESVALFLQRSQAILPDFQMNESNAGAIAEICIHLDGLPLALELAAARIKLLPPQALLSRLEHRFHVLTAGARDVPVRQQTLQNTIAWSYHLLDTHEQRLFRRLSVFVGGCMLEAVEGVCYESKEAALSALDEIASLLDKSLLQQTAYDGKARLVMLETIREYGLERLRESGEANRIQSAHARYFLSMVEELEPQRFGAQAITVQDQLEREFENLRSALKYLAEKGEQELALRLAGALWWFWYARGHLSEGWQWYELLLSNSEGVAPEVRAQALVHCGWVAYQLADNAHAGPLLKESLSLYRQLGNKEKTGVALFRLGLIAEYEGDIVAAQAMHEEALQLFTELAYKEGIADSALELSDIHIERGDYSGAHRLAEQAVMLHREIGDQWGLGFSLLLLARTVLLLGDGQTAQNLTKECLALSIWLGDKYRIAACLEQLAEIAVARGAPERAAQLWGVEEVLKEKAHAMGYPIKSLFFENMRAERLTKAVYRLLGEQVFADAWAQGRALTPEQVLAAQESVVIPPPTSSRETSTILVKPPPHPDGLTVREVEVLRLVAGGLTDEQVAKQLVISPRTVNSHLTSIYNKISVSSRSAATRYAIDHHFI
jgi:predicted ATPase/DNA-binding CsgD family transcriptional regulator